MTTTARAQYESAEFVHLTPRDGLSDSFTWRILQDTDGFIWIGTGAGLDRFDGYSVQRFIHDPQDTTSIRSGSVHALLEDVRGRLWVGSATGVSRFDPERGVFARITLDTSVPSDSQFVLSTWALLEDADGTIWAGTANGLYALREDANPEITHYAHDPDDAQSIGSSLIYTILQDGDGSIWIGTREDGVARLDVETGTFEHFRADPERPDALGDEWVWTLYQDSREQLWVGTARGGLCRFLDAEAFDCLRHDPDEPASPGANGIQAIYEDAEGLLWLGTDGGGVSIYDPVTGTFTHIKNDPTNPATLGEDDVHHIYRDRFGTVWFSHHSRGVSRMTPGRVRFVTHLADPDASSTAPANTVSDVLEDEDGIQWMATLYGLVRHDPATATSEHFVPFPDAAPRPGPFGNPNLLSSIVQDRLGRLWMGNAVGDLLTFDREERSFRKVAAPETTEWIQVLEIDREGHIWILTEGAGLWRLDPIAEHVVQYRPDADSPDAVAGETAVPFLDENDNVWVIAYEGQDFGNTKFQRFDREREAFVSFDASLPSDIGPGWGFMFPDEPGVFWVDSSTGLFRVDVQSGEVTSFARSVFNLPPNIRGLQRDDRGRLWYGTWTGSFGVFDPESGSDTPFYRQDGLQFFRYLDSRKLETGELIFAGFGGYVRFHPDDVIKDGIPPEVHVTSMLSAGQAVDMGRGDSPIRITHDRNMLEFEYVALHFAEPVRNQYRYRLEGFEEGWNRAGMQRRAIYPRLPPGKYTFRVQAASGEGIWNEAGAAVAFTVLPPWWRTIWAYGLYAALLIGGVFAVDRVQRRHLVSRERERARERELEQAREIEEAYNELKRTQTQLIHQEKLASLGQLTAGIAHEIKNPLNFVNNFAALTVDLVDELDEEKSVNPDLRLSDVEDILGDLRTNAEKISEHGKRADRIVRSMLEHSRGGRGERRAADLNALVDEYAGLAFHGMRAQRSDFTCAVEKSLDPTLPRVEMIPQDVGRVLLNLLGNAFDAVHEKRLSLDGQGLYEPRVEITTALDRTGVMIRIRDNGTGMPEHVRQRIYEPFFTTKPTGEGTGLGLSMSHDIIVQGHGGTIQVDSESGRFTEFIVTLPLPRTSAVSPITNSASPSTEASSSFEES